MIKNIALLFYGAIIYSIETTESNQMPNEKLVNFLVKYTLLNGESGEFEARSPSSTIAALDFCQWAYECGMVVSSMAIEEDSSHE